MKLIFALLMISSGAYAADMTCTVKGMHCKGCAESVDGKVCDKEKYATCDISIKDEKKEIGAVHIITKDKDAKIDEKLLSKQIEDAGYKLDKCKASTPVKKKG